MRDFLSSLKTVDGNEGDKCYHRTRLDTYGCGCSHDCSYCYAKSLLDFRELWRPDAPAVADMKTVSRQIRKIPKSEVVRLGGMTDCFQPIEKLHKATYKTIRLLNKAQREYLIVTKSALVAEYADILDKDKAHIQITVTCLDDERTARYEKASPPSERIRAIKKLQEMGFDVQLRLSPFVPEYIDTDRLATLGIDKCVVEFLRANTWIKKWFDTDYSQYTVSQGGYYHMPLEAKKRFIERVSGFNEVTVCEDENEAYNWWKNNFNPNPDDCCNLRRRTHGISQEQA